ncbi:MAG: hypothetical protein COW56_14225 [Rhodocyclales bacterium CG17_big_fil_post_rev_8_21_14_2_50_68_7]|nr:MAG: hypothetical protein AUK49_14300 [Betaproteobacteria bacterium CG2_30_68_42]PIV71556.1 MAG: hypothetical protein COW56_14225 [Rhodocyclales bacterium CG17_big_fil_post_rev_8_21_14_2_50_68_7]PIX76445.1 MAG: hypothetical protein COZ38_00240 [Rhodocyclales bacterium CG_4_10_14_3_um_filter_68_10]PJA57051.1 MAG: hypothetical protein CO164_09765 [Rhodocyclales bacterium CG_4_9_14_3_um_filter_68_10]
MTDIVNTTYALFARLGYTAIFLGVMLDGAGIPVPGEVVLLLTGSLAAEGQFSLPAAIAVAATGAVVIDSLWFAVGRIGSARLIALYCRVSFGSTACMVSTERNLARFGPRSLLYARFVPGFRTFAAPMAGMSGLAYGWFLLYDGIGALLWAALGISSGALFADRLASLLAGLESVHGIIGYVAVAALLMFVLMKWLVRRLHGRARIETTAGSPQPSRKPV